MQGTFGPASRSVSRTTIEGGAGAPTDATYLVAAAHAGLSAEVVVGVTPGGELGGSWASPTVDASHGGGTHAAAQSAAEATAAAADAAHVAAGDPHSGYLKESDFATLDLLVGTATGLLSGEIVVGTAPAGELGGTWASPTVDASHGGGTHAAATAAAVATSQAALDVVEADLTAVIDALVLSDLADVADGGNPQDGQIIKWVFDTDTQTGAYQPSDVPFITEHSALSGTDDPAAHAQYAGSGHGHAGEDILDNRFTRHHAFSNPGATANRVCFIAPFDCKIRGIHAFRSGGTSATMNARVNGTTSVAALSPAADTPDSNTSVDVDVASGEYVEAQITAIVGTATYIFVQLDIERTGA